MTRKEAFAKLRATFPIWVKHDLELNELINAMIALGVLKLRR